MANVVFLVFLAVACAFLARWDVREGDLEWAFIMTFLSGLALGGGLMRAVHLGSWRVDKQKGE